MTRMRSGFVEATLLADGVACDIVERIDCLLAIDCWSGRKGVKRFDWNLLDWMSVDIGRVAMERDEMRSDGMRRVTDD